MTDMREYGGRLTSCVHGPPSVLSKGNAGSAQMAVTRIRSAESVVPKAEAAMTIFRCSGLVQGSRLLAHPVSSDTSRLQADQLMPSCSMLHSMQCSRLHASCSPDMPSSAHASNLHSRAWEDSTGWARVPPDNDVDCSGPPQLQPV